MPTSTSMMKRSRSLAPLLVLIAALLLLAAPWRGAGAAESGSDFAESCKLGGGYNWLDIDNSQSCCWDNWGCVVCSRDSDGYIIAGSCRVKCSSAACAEANAMTTGNPALPDTVRNPEQFFGPAPGAVAPPQTKKPKAETAPDTVQP